MQGDPTLSSVILATILAVGKKVAVLEKFWDGQVALFRRPRRYPGQVKAGQALHSSQRGQGHAAHGRLGQPFLGGFQG